MAFEYEALIGHLNVIGGRVVSANPPGSLVEVAPQKAARGRDVDTFFTLVLPTGATIGPASFYEQMAQHAAERYFDTSGSVSAALREVLVYLNENLVDHNRTAQGSTFLADQICAVLRGEDLIVGRVGGAVAALWHEGALTILASDPVTETSLPLGAQHMPDIKFSRHKVARGSRLLMADAPFTQMSPEKVSGALSELGLDMMLVRLRESAILQLAVLAVEFVPPEQPSPQPVPEGENSAAIQQAVRTAETGKPAGRGAPNARGVGFGAVLIQRTFGLIAGLIARVLGLFTGGIEKGFGPDPDGEKRWFQSPTVAGLAILFPVVLVGLVVALWLGGTGQTEYELCLQEANGLAEIARQVPSSNPDGLRSTWGATIQVATRCKALRPDDEPSGVLISDGQNVIDQLNQVTRREAKLLQTLPDAQFTRILVQGLDVYVLDSSRQRVYTTTLTQSGLELTRSLTPILDMSKGATVSGFAVGDFIDIGFSAPLDALYALDRTGVLVICRRRQVQSCEAQRLRDSEKWTNPLSMAVWGPEDRIYLLDVAANQIWRYDRTGGAYSGIANPYFDGANQGALQRCVDFKIDKDGQVFALRSDGVIIKYYRGQVQEFRLGGFPLGQEPISGESLTLDEDPIGRAIYVTSRAAAAVHEMTLGGSFDANIMATEESLFQSLGGVASNPAQQLLYLTSGNGIFVVQK